MFRVIVPTLNAAGDWPRFSQSLLENVEANQVLVLDSESTDGTQNLVLNAGMELRTIKRAEFNHGATRQYGAEVASDAEVLVYLTQDAVLASPDAIRRLLAVFQDSEVGAVYGRQLPRPGAGAIEAHAREFNYPRISNMRTLESRRHLGLKAAFLSNSMAAYRRSVLISTGGFPSSVIFGEDMCVAARMLLSGKKIAYVADACAYHSHNYTSTQEFKRYFDIGVLHSREAWLLKEFGSVQGEGKRFVFSELHYLLKKNPAQIPAALLRAGSKLLGYRLGQMEAKLPQSAKRAMSMHSKYWT
ncbi:glycosyltransferase [Terracidiphilus gabretensis]|uniref:glycosyltransferase n=1 Tax=Terracidiphilus gabretensis TaxID=1577687 RepID=UPI00071B4149|nr:glycosyltransferase family 2 protein [Terracidiphilus gabretensis]